MANLPTVLEMTGANVTEAQFKLALKQLIENIESKDDARLYVDTNKLDLSKIVYEYVDGNKIGAKTPRYTDLGVYGTLAITANSAFDSLVLEVNEGVILFLLNDSQNYNASQGGGYAFFAEDPNLNRTQSRIVDNRVSAIDATTSLTYNKVTVPVGAKYLMINTRWTNPSAIRTDFTWAVHANKFSNSYVSGNEAVRRINGVKLVLIDDVSKAKDEAILAAKNDPTKLSTDQVRIDYIGGNKIGPKTSIILGSGVNTSYVFGNYSSFDCVKMQVTAGQVLRLHNQEANYNVAQGAIFNFFAAGTAGESTLTDDRVLRTDIETSKTYYEVTVPVGATYLILNKRFTSSTPTTYIFTWGVYSTDAFSFDYKVGKETVISISGAGFKENTLTTGNDADLFVKSDVIKGYLNSPGALAGATEDWRVFKMDVKEGKTYYIKLKPVSFSYPFKIIYSKSINQTSSSADFVSNVSYTPTNIADVYRFTVPTGSGIKSMLMNIKVDTGSYTLNIVDSLSIQEGGFNTNNVGVNRKSVSAINGNSIKDEIAREGLAPIANKLESRFLNKKVFCFGDSITQGTEGGYVQYLSQILGCELSNFGSSGGTASRCVDIITAGSGLPKRNSSTEGTVWPTKDFTTCSAATIQIGTNDSHTGTLADIPTGDISDYADPLEYWALFPSNYVANIALCIEYIKSKNPECEIFLITPPYRNVSGDTPSRMANCLPFLRLLSEHYSIPLINSMQNSGIGFKYMKPNIKYSYDGIHFNALGNKLWGKYIAQKILNTP